jgi:hypothetical protein
MKTTVFYDGEKGTARLDVVKEVHHNIDIHKLTRITLFDDDSFRDAVMNVLGLDDEEEANELLANDDIRQRLLLMVAYEIINHPTKY